jgi:hypothetical protein
VPEQAGAVPGDFTGASGGQRPPHLSLPPLASPGPSTFPRDLRASLPREFLADIEQTHHPGT